MKRVFSVLLAVFTVFFAVFGTVACGKKETPAGNAAAADVHDNSENNGPAPEPAYPVYAVAKNVYLLEYGKDKDYVSLWDKFGKEVTLADVEEDEDGLAYIVRDGVAYKLGLDFLTMAMVCTVDDTKDEAGRNADYAAWYKYYVTRWNYLMPEIPLYSNLYYDVYNTKIGGVREHPTNAYWRVADALIEWTSADGSITIGSTADLTGLFRYPAWKTASAGVSDADINTLISGLSTVVIDKEGAYRWNDTVVAAHTETVNADGSKTFDITIKDDLKYSDGSAVKAADYVAGTLVFSTPVAKAAAGVDKKAAAFVKGFDTFAVYTGVAAAGATKELAGIRVYGNTRFSVTVSADCVPYFYDLTYASFTPTAPGLWLGDNTVEDDGRGAYLSEDFYAKTEGTYDMAAHIAASAANTDTAYPYSGPYAVTSYDTVTGTATLTKNAYFAGNHEGTVPSIDTVVYKKIVSATQMSNFLAGDLDVIAGITGGDEIAAALDVVNGGNGAYGYVTYTRAGYGALAFRCDFGPTQFRAVRQAIACCVDRVGFAEAFTGGYGVVVDGPYCPDAWMYKAVAAQGMQLNAYAASVDKAVEILEADGWIYNVEGGAYTTGVRYKKIPGDRAGDTDKTYASKDGTYTTVKIGDDYYMPLILNWYGTDGSPFTELLDRFLHAEAIAQAGFAVCATKGDFYPMLSEFRQQDYYAVYGGTPLYNCFNFTVDYAAAVYDYAGRMTVNSGLYADCSAYYIKDTADVFLNVAP